MAESFFQMLESERIRSQIYPIRNLARSDVFDCIAKFYHLRSLDGAAEGLSPAQFERSQSQRFKSD